MSNDNNYQQLIELSNSCYDNSQDFSTIKKNYGDTLKFIKKKFNLSVDDEDKITNIKYFLINIKTSGDRSSRFAKVNLEAMVKGLDPASKTGNINKEELDDAPASVSNIENAIKDSTQILKIDNYGKELSKYIKLNDTYFNDINHIIPEPTNDDDNNFMKDLFKLLFDYGSILNKPTILNLLSFSKNPATLIETLKKISSLNDFNKINELFNLFFIKVPYLINNGSYSYDDTIPNAKERYIYNGRNSILTTKPFININNVISDTIVLRQYLLSNSLDKPQNQNAIKKNSQVIFIGTIIKLLIDIINSKDTDNFVNSYNRNDDNKALYKYLYNNILKQLVNINKILILNDKNDNISITLGNAYKKYYKENASVLTFIKVRQDTPTPNPRYDIRSDNDNLIVDYYNCPDKFDDEDGIVNLNAIGPRQQQDKETYIIGPINKYYNNKDTTNEAIARDEECGSIIKKKIEKGENIVVIGNGQSGSGKTSSLINLYNSKENRMEPGILPLICSTLKSDINKIVVRMLDIYLNFDSKFWDQNKNFQNDIQGKHNLVKPIKYGDSYSIEFIRKSGSDWINSNDKSLGEVITAAFDLREIEPTKNNPNSSRSHVLVLLDIYAGPKLQSKFVICDLAGVEDVFTCSPKELLKLNDNYANLSDKYGINSKDRQELIVDSNECKDEYNTTSYKNILASKEDSRFKYKNDTFNTLTDAIQFLSSAQKGGSKATKQSCYNTKTIDDFMKEYYQFTKTFRDILNNDLPSRFKEQYENYNPLKEYEKNFSYIKILDNLITHNNNFEYIIKNVDLYLKLYDGTTPLPSPKTVNEMYYDKNLYIWNENKKEFIKKNINFSNFVKELSALTTKNPIKSFSEPRGAYNVISAKENTIAAVLQLFSIKYLQKAKETYLKKMDWNKINNAIKDIIRYSELEYNCKIRRMEGYLINNSLKQMQIFINNFIIDKETDKFRKNILKNENEEYKKIVKPLLHSLPSTNTNIRGNTINCYNKDYLYNYQYELFSKNIDKKTISESEIIMKIIFDDKPIKTYSNDDIDKYITPFGLDKYNTTLVIFTIINLTAKSTVNNPPTPPYVNTNKLKQMYNILYYIKNYVSNPDTTAIRSYYNNISSIFNNFNAKLNRHPFYESISEDSNSQLVLELSTIQKYLLSKQTDMLDSLKKYIEIIDGNNSATLIGTIELNKFSEPRDPNFMYYNCNIEENDYFESIYKSNCELCKIKPPPSIAPQLPSSSVKLPINPRLSNNNIPSILNPPYLNPSNNNIPSILNPPYLDPSSAPSKSGEPIKPKGIPTRRRLGGQ